MSKAFLEVSHEVLANSGKELFNLIQQYGREEVVTFLKKVGDLGMSFMPQGEENTARLFQLAQQDNWQGIVTNYLAINSGIEGCYKMYGTEAKRISQSDLKNYQEVLENLDNEVEKSLHQVNDLIIACALKQSSDAKVAAIQSQEDLKVILSIIALYKSGKLQEEIYLGSSPYIHIFGTEEGDFGEIVLSLHGEETEMSEASIRWKVKRKDSNVISLRLDKDRWTHQVYLDVSSNALEKMYQIIGRESGHHFEVDVPGLTAANIFKTLVRIFY